MILYFFILYFFILKLFIKINSYVCSLMKDNFYLKESDVFIMGVEFVFSSVLYGIDIGNYFFCLFVVGVCFIMIVEFMLG